MTLLPVLALALLWLAVSRSSQGKRLLRAATGIQGAKLVSIALAAAALVVLARGGVWEALCLFGFSVYLLNKQSGTSKAAPQSLSRVRSAFVELVHDGQTGRLWGTVLAGPLRGAPLDVLTREQCVGLFRACQAQDQPGAAYLQPYLDRRFPGWGAAMNDNGDPRPGRARFTSRMTEEEANQVLGLRHGAPRDEIVRAHRAAMKKWHPDQGGSADLAARANEAKEVLLRRHP